LGKKNLFFGQKDLNFWAKAFFESFPRPSRNPDFFRVWITGFENSHKITQFLVKIHKYFKFFCEFLVFDGNFVLVYYILASILLTFSFDKVKTKKIGVLILHLNKSN
jgi:hypothetical protein